jgi:hypothetical protein
MMFRNLLTAPIRRPMEHFGFIIPGPLAWRNPLSETRVRSLSIPEDRALPDRKVKVLLHDEVLLGTDTPYEFGPPIAGFVAKEAMSS